MNEKTLNGCTQSFNRAPLIVVTLYLPSEAKTLAPFEVRRDIRRPPSFCQKFRRNSSSKQCKCKINAKPDLVMRGREITETKSNLCSLPPNQDIDEILRNEDKTNDECISCSACTIEIGRTTPSLCKSPCTDETAADFSFNKYHMDSFGNLTRNLEEIPYTENDDDENDSLDYSMSVKNRLSSAYSSRIIRITLNNKSNVDSNKPNSDEDRNVVPRDC